MDQVENVHFKINKKEMPAEILKLFVNEKRAKVLVMCTDEEFSYFNEVNKIAEMIRVSERKEAEKLLHTDVAMVLIDPYYGENKEHESGVSIDDMYSEGMSFFTELIESEINLPIYFIEFEKIWNNVFLFMYPINEVWQELFLLIHWLRKLWSDRLIRYWKRFLWRKRAESLPKEVMCLISIQHRFFHQMKRDYLFSIMI